MIGITYVACLFGKRVCQNGELRRKSEFKRTEMTEGRRIFSNEGPENGCCLLLVVC